MFPKPWLDSPQADAPTVPRSGRARRFSPLTLRILAVNLIAPLTLLVGLFYLDHYEDGLIAAEVNALRADAEMIAAAVGEGAVEPAVIRPNGPAAPSVRQRLDAAQARAMIRRLSRPGGVRARLFDGDGLLIADSRRRSGPRGAVRVLDLDPPPATLAARIRAWLRMWVLAVFPAHSDAPVYREASNQTAKEYSEVIAALEDGTIEAAVRRLETGEKILSAAAPVKRYKRIVAAVLVSRSDSATQDGLFAVRLAILQLMVGILIATTLLSIYLARAIVRPMRVLAFSAERVRHGWRTTLHRLPRRRDEIGDLSASLEAMTEALWARIDAIERFAADVSHEIKNPLTSIHSAVETLGLIKDSGKQARLLAILKGDVERLNRLITDISDASRLDGELSRSERKPVDMLPLARTLVDISTPVDGRRVVLEDPRPDGPALVWGMEDRLVQVLRNLIANALSFSPSDGVVSLAVSVTAESVTVTVDDDGPGLPPGKETAIFERFYSERPKGEAFGEHSGLGLSISKQIIDCHGGTLAAANRRGEGGRILGARFTATLPKA